MAQEPVASHLIPDSFEEESWLAPSGRRDVGAEGLLSLPFVGDNGDAGRRKALGAYYTDAVVAEFLVRWAVQRSWETVLDPSAGDGAFLTAASGRLKQLGGNPDTQVFGVEIDGGACEQLIQSLAEGSGARLLQANFFDVSPGELPPAHAVVGNPPFVRYQRFVGDGRRLALSRSREAGVQLSQLTSSWAPFVVHATRFVRPGGRLAMVVPVELAYATYARPVLEYLCRSFGKILLLCFSRRLFASLSEDTALLLADCRGGTFEDLRLAELPGIPSLAACEDPERNLPQGVKVDASAVLRGDERLLQYLLPSRCRDLYRQLRGSAQVVALGDLARVGIGYVTGDNDFFHLNRQVISAYGLSQQYLRPAVCAGADLSGLRFTEEDWRRLQQSGRPTSLLHIRKGQPLTASLQAYLLQGVRRGVPNRYKCRVRKPWYRVPHVYEADGFLTYMSGREPRLVSNHAAAVAPNTLHVVQMLPGAGYSMDALSAVWQTSLTAFSCEMEGHSLGGGMLKLEPKEARKVVVALAGLDNGALENLSIELDEMMRCGRCGEASDRADAVILREGLGLGASDIQQLRDGLEAARTRRLNR